MVCSDSQLDYATTFCFVDCHMIGLFTKKKITRVVQGPRRTLHFY
jgi:hypothetical protein